MHDAADLARRLENLIQLGTVASVDPVAARCTVSAGDLLTAPLPWLVPRAGDARTWWAPSVGEQVVLLSPGGDPARGIVLPAIYADLFPRPAGADKARVAVYPDGAEVSYDPAAHALRATLPAGGTAALTAPGGVTITGDVSITGKLHVSDDVTLDATAAVAGDVTSQGDVKAGTVSLKHHKHTGVSAGGSLSGEPQP